MSYRDEDGAKAARIDALQDQVEELRAENERLKAGAAPKAQNTEPAPSKQERKQKPWARRGARDEWLYALGATFGAVVVTSIGIFCPIPFGHEMPRTFGIGMASMLGILLGGISWPSALLRILLPAVPIMAKDENGAYVVHRSMKARKIYLAVSIVSYVAGAIGWWFVTKLEGS